MIDPVVHSTSIYIIKGKKLRDLEYMLICKNFPLEKGAGWKKK